MIKSISTMAISAAIAAAVFIAIPALVKANAPIGAAKADLADAPVECISQGWPYYARGCLRDDSRNAGRAVTVRLVTTDRIDEQEARAAAAPALEAAALPPQTPEAPAGWMMSDEQLRLHIAAGDFIRRTVP